NDIAVGRRALKSGDRLTLGDEQFVVAVGAEPRLWVWLLPVAGMAVFVAAGFVVERSRSSISFEHVAESAARSVFLIAVEQSGKRSVVGTSFVAAADGILATNAHIAEALEKVGGL